MNIKIEQFNCLLNKRMNTGLYGKYYIYCDGKYMWKDCTLHHHMKKSEYFDTVDEAQHVLSKFLNNNKKVVEPKFNLDNLSLEELCVIKAALGTSLAGAVSDRLFERCNRLLKLDYSYTPIFSDFVMKWDYQGYRKLLQEVIEKAKSNF